MEEDDASLTPLRTVARETPSATAPFAIIQKDQSRTTAAGARRRPPPSGPNYLRDTGLGPRSPTSPCSALWNLSSLLPLPIPANNHQVFSSHALASRAPCLTLESYKTHWLVGICPDLVGRGDPSALIRVRSHQHDQRGHDIGLFALAKQVLSKNLALLTLIVRSGMRKSSYRAYSGPALVSQKGYRS